MWQDIIKKELSEADYMKMYFQMIKESPLFTKKQLKDYLYSRQYHEDANIYANIMMRKDKKERQKANLRYMAKIAEEQREYAKQFSHTGIGVNDDRRIENYDKYVETSLIELLEETLEKEGGAADLGKLVEAVENKHSNIVSEKELKAVLDNSPQFKQLEEGNYTLVDR
tara:strand:- start:2951 stop:3457 length:507 start_codon:yes stop_codon:yes gene_type:complete